MIKPEAGMLLCTVYLAVVACDANRATAQRITRQDSASVEIVRNLGPDRMLDWTFERIWTIGGAEDDGLLLSDLDRNQIATDSLGGVVLLDIAEKQVVVLGNDGTVSRRFGREGRGPGELSNPLVLDIGPQSDVAVYDRGKAAVVRWAMDGTFLDETRIDDFFWGRRFRVTRLGTLYGVLDPAPNGELPQRLLRSVDGAVGALQKFTPLPSRPGEFPSCPRFGAAAPPLFAPQFVWDAEGEKVAVVTTPYYRIDVLGSNGTVRSIRRDLKPAEVDDALALEELVATERLNEGHLEIPALGCNIPPEELIRARGYARLLPVVADLVYGPNGELWVLRNGVGAAPDLIDVFARDGEYLGTLPPDSPLPAAFAGNGRFIALSTDSLDVPVITAYSVRRN